MATFTNRATLSYSGGTVNSNITTGEILEVLSLTKTAVGDEYSTRSDVAYVVNAINSGNTAINALTLTDNLGEYSLGAATYRPLDYVEGSARYFVNGVLQPNPTVSTTDNLVISAISIPANSEATIAYRARPNAFASPESGGEITNTATLSSPTVTSVSAEETVTALQEANLTITKSVAPTVVTENGQITYTFLIQNTGNKAADAADNVVVTDTFNPILSDISVTYNSAAWTEGTNYAYDATTGLFTTLAGQIVVPAATFEQNATTGEWEITPGSVVLSVTGTI